MRQRDVAHFCTCIFQHRGAIGPKFLNFFGHSIDPIFARDADGFAPNVTRQKRLEIGNGQIGGCAVFGVMPHHRGPHDCGVPHRFGHWPCLIKARGKGHNSPARAAPIGRFQTHCAGKGGRLADRASRIRAGCPKTEVSRNRSGRSSRRPPGRQVLIAALCAPRVDGWPVNRGFVGRPHGKLIHIEFAQHDRACIAQLR